MSRPSFSDSKRAGVLYLSYDGMLEPLGQSQVLAYLEKLATEREIHLLSFEKREDWADEGERERIRVRIQKAGIHWHPLRYHRRPSSVATAYDIAVGSILALYLVVRFRLRIVHARSYVASVIALVTERLTGTKFIFDMRGFWADERVDGGLWPRGGFMYRLAKWFEERFLRSASHVVSLTLAALVEIAGFPALRERRPAFTVIPTCVDLSRFRPAPTPSGGFILGYVGSAGTWYLFDAFARCFAELRELIPDARLLVLNRGEHEYIRQCLAVASVPLDVCEIRAVQHSEVPAQMARMHAGAFFIKPLFSKKASAPTKLGEFLGCGIACLTNSGVGDMAAILEQRHVGVAIDAFEPADLRSGLQELTALLAQPGIRERCVAAAEENFSLESGVSKYRAIYRTLGNEEAG